LELSSGGKKVKNRLRIALLIAVPFVVSFVVDSGALAQVAASNEAIDQTIDLLRKDLRSERKQLVAMNLPLTDDEAVKFWPVYERYSAEVAKVFDSRIALIKEYATAYPNVSDEQAVSLLKRSIELEQNLLQVRQKYVPLVEQVLPAKKATMFFQMDRRLGLLLELQLASEIPMVTP